MTPRSALVTSLLLLGSASLEVRGQGPTPTALFPVAGSQANAAAAGLLVTGSVQAPGFQATPLLQLLQPGSSSTTLAYLSVGSVPTPGPGSLDLLASVSGAPGSAFALALSVAPSISCGGFAGAPCLTGPLLLGSQATPAGLYHLDPMPFVLLDGLGVGQGGVPAALDGQGSFQVAGSIPVDTVINGGVEQSLAFQALVADPGAPAGLRFTAALTVAQWVQF